MVPSTARILLWCVVGAAFHFLLVLSCAIAQTDDFQDGTTQNWAWGMPGVGGPENVAGGQGGATDLYIQNESFGGDDAPGTRMTIINRAQWDGRPPGERHHGHRTRRH